MVLVGDYCVFFAIFGQPAVYVPPPKTSPSNDSSSSKDKDKPTLPKESKSKLKQRDSLENKLFIISTTEDVGRDIDRKRESEIEGPEDLSALNYFSELYGNESDY